MADGRQTSVIRWLCATVGLLVWLLTLGRPPGPAVLFNYLALIVSCLAWTALICRRWGSRGFLYLAPVWAWRGFLYLAPALLALVVGVYACLDRYTLTWYRIPDQRTGAWRQSDDPGEIFFARQVGKFSVYKDTYRRWAQTGFYRRHCFFGSSVCGMVEGRMSPGGNPHGPCSESFFTDDAGVSERIWYWYGEKISEGEWHLRNK